MKKFYRYVCIILCLCMIPLAACAPEENKPPKEEIVLNPKFCLAAAKIPERTPFPQEQDYATYEEFNNAYDVWHNEMTQKYQYTDQLREATHDFSLHTVKEMLDVTEGENAVCSPANLFMALSMLAEVTDGESRAQILALLGQNNIDELRTTADTLWQSLYTDDGATACIPANALFLRDENLYNEQTVNTVAEKHHASLFHGKMGSKEYTKALQDWINAQTRGLLKEQADSLETAPDNLMILASTLYFSGKWSDQFRDENNYTAPFHGAKGDTEVQYMKQSACAAYYQGEQFDAVCKSFEMDGNMWLIRPKEGESLKKILADKEWLSLMDKNAYENFVYPLVHLRIPKFDISDSIDLKEALPRMGITEVFDTQKANFTPLTNEPCVLDKARHDARVMIDEEGCKAAAFTVMVGEGASSVELVEIEFTLDRPFIFVLEFNSVPLFVGVVQNV